jgi:hypothetical protein
MPSAWAEPSHYNFPSILHFNNQVWKLGAQHESPKSILAEYVINNETATQWSQLFSYQQMLQPLPDNVTPRDYADRIESSFKGKNLHYVFHLLNTAENEAMVEFKVEQAPGIAQHELMRIIKTKNSIFVLMHYVTKQAKLSEAERKMWIDNLQSMPVIII